MLKNKILLINVFLTVATVITFWQVTRCEFINLDDTLYVTENTHIMNGITQKAILWAFTTGHAGNWHPLTMISHMLDVQIFGLNPHRHHLTSLLFHVASTLTLFFALNRTTKAPWKSAFVAALFALHPLHVESVAWVSERKDVLSGFFLMLTIAAYAYYAERPNFRRYVPVILFFVLGLMAKPMLVTLPFVLLLFDYWPLKRLNRWGSIPPLLMEKIPLFAMTAFSSVVTYVAQHKAGAVQSIEVFPLRERIANAFASYMTYIAKMVWPNNLAIFYPYPEQRQFWQVLGAALILIVVTLMVIWMGKQFKYLIVGWLWYIGALVPVIGLVQVGGQAWADRYSYIPLIGLFMMVAWGVPELLGDWYYRKETCIISSIVVLSVFLIITWTQVGYWLNSITLFDHTLQVTSRNYLIYQCRGDAYAKLGKYWRAVYDYGKVIEINPEYQKAYINRGAARVALGNNKQAIRDYDRAIEIDPHNAEAFYSRGVLYQDLGNLTQAVLNFDRAIEINSNFDMAYNNRGIAYANLGNYSHAISDYDMAIKINPGYNYAYSNRGAAHAALGNNKEAISDFSMAIEINHGYACVYRNRGVVYAELGNYSRAISDFDKAIEIDPEDAVAYHDRSVVHAKLGHDRQATEDLKAAARLGSEEAKNLLRSQGINW